MNPLTVTLLIMAGVIGVIAYKIAVKRGRLRKQKEAYAAAIQPRVDWAREVMAAGSDEMIVSLTEPRVDWKGPHLWGLSSIVEDAGNKVYEAKRRLNRKRLQQQTRDRFEATAVLEQLSERMEEYLRIYFNSYDHDDAELAEMKAKIKQDAIDYVTNLLESARAGYRQLFVELDGFTTRPYEAAPDDYRRLTDEPYEVPDDWDELVVRYYKTPLLCNFRHDYGISTSGSLRLLAIDALKQESLLLAQVVLAYYDSRATWREEVGEILMTDLGKMVHRLQVERELVFA